MLTAIPGFQGQGFPESQPAQKVPLSESDRDSAFSGRDTMPGSVGQQFPLATQPDLLVQGTA